MEARIPDGYGPDDELDHDGPDPVWLQLAAVLVARIERGRYQIRRPIPSAARLSDEFDVAVNTARKSVSLLGRLGYVRPVAGKGAFVVARSDGVPDGDS